MISEVMLLGFISLLLTLGEESISKICVDRDAYDTDWIPIEALSPCDSCFKNTRRLSDDFNSTERCDERKDSTSLHKDIDEEHDHHSHTRRTLLSHTSDWHSCSGDEVQFISERALHEVHSFIFLVAVTHVFVVVMMFLIATWRVQQLKRWNFRDAEPSCFRISDQSGHIVFFGRSRQIASGRPNTLAVLLGSHRTRQTLRPVNEDENRLMQHSTAASPEDTQQNKDIRILEGFIQKCKTGQGYLEDEQQDASSSQGGPSAVNDGEAPSQHTAIELMTRCNTLIRVPNSLIDSTDGRGLPEMDSSLSRQEWATAFQKQFWSFITKDEFRYLTAGFFIEYKRTSRSHFAKLDNLNYEEFLSSSLDDDIDTVVRIPLTGWVFFTAGYTLWAVMDWSAWPVLAIILILEAVVTIICAKLLTIVMLLTKGNKLCKLTSKAFWFDDAGLLLPIIRNILFILTVILASILQMSWQYGIRSCPLAGRVADDHWIHEAATPLVFVFNTLCFLHISFILVPLYSVTVHTSSLRFNKNLPRKLAKQAFHRLLEELKHEHCDGNPSTRTG